MVGITDRFFRRFYREITKNTILYTPMIHSQAIFHQTKKGQCERLLGFDPLEKPLILQVAGDQPTILAFAAKMAKQLGYDGINLNLGCPASSARSGNFGACLMLKPKLVTKCIEAIHKAADIAVSVKHRLGIDIHQIDERAYQDLKKFMMTLGQAGCQHFIIHARTALLEKKMTTKDNRKIPPLEHHWVIRLASELPEYKVELNGGIQSISQGEVYLNKVYRIMIGRAAVKHPLIFAAIDDRYIQNKQWQIQEKSEQKTTHRRQILQNYLSFLTNYTQVDHTLKRIDFDDWEIFAVKMKEWKVKLQKRNFSPHLLFAPLYNLYYQQKGSRAFRKILSQS